jgi:hypothetical protein
MSQPVVATHIIGQTPRPALTELLAGRFPGVEFAVHGALDGLDRDEIPECPPRGYPLETRLQDGTRVVVDAAFLEPRLQDVINGMDAEASVHLLLCAGPFPNLTVPTLPVVPTPLIRPFDAAVAEFKKRGYRTLDVVVPFAGQASSGMDKWGAEGFACRAHVFTEKPRHRSLTEWLSGLVKGTRAQALVFDYVGFPADTRDEVAAAVPVPVFDLGHLAMDALEETLKTL